jgi:hypothetical protein
VINNFADKMEQNPYSPLQSSLSLNALGESKAKDKKITAVSTASDQKPWTIAFFSSLALLNILMVIWSNYDHALPVYDMDCHLLSASKVSDLLAHAHPGHRYWWQSMLAVSPLYPPFVYLVYGFFKLVLGPGRWVELLVQHFFSSILFANLYGLSKLLFRLPSIALLSALLIFTFPTVFVLTHYDMLDIPGLSMVALALFCFTRWHQKPSLLSSILLGTACAFTALTKNNSVAFLIAPFAISLLQSCYQRDSRKIKAFVIVTITGLAIMLPWLLVACRTMLKTVAIYQNTDYHAGFMQHITYYLSNLPTITSYFLFTIFILALGAASKSIHRQMLFVLASGIGGIFILSLFHWTEQIRYALPATIPIALYCAWAIVNYFNKPKTHLFCLASIILVCFAFIENNFTPYPLRRFDLPQSAAIFLGIEPARADAHHAPGGTSNYPTPPSDWGYQWVFKTIKTNLTNSDIKPNAPVQQFAIMPDSEEVSSTSYAYLARRNNLPIHPFTPRNYTLTGDEFTFKPDTAKTIDWYLLKTGSAISPASHFCNKESALAYKRWCDFVRDSQLFKLIGTKSLPDGTKLLLYKLNKKQE